MNCRFSRFNAYCIGWMPGRTLPKATRHTEIRDPWISDIVASWETVYHSLPGGGINKQRHVRQSRHSCFQKEQEQESPYGMLSSSFINMKKTTSP
ncbi:hypothetical protein SUGI_1494200 [Cryptomeria japonica]|uniref:Uncharacterized protein n=1 Tax=Cryptomeria japonica TaxID=3369 RepID=A0AAD3NPW3_CRYJA|nr:hypothetical protein SUGI_1224340 [Cryptomeria japonica]GLJ59146.1 hypothetical protein SUGI_1494200 [Cryptomeria japonica]